MTLSAHSQPEGHKRDSAFLGLKWADDQICSSSHWNKGQLTESIWSWLELLWLGQWRIQPPSCGRMAKVQWSIRKRFLKHCYLWLAFIFMFLVVQIWTEKGELNAVLCTDFHKYPEVFVSFFCFVFCRLLQAHMYCHSTFLVCNLPLYSILPYWWTLGATVLHIEIPELGQNFLFCCCCGRGDLLKNLSHQVHFICPETF